VSHRSYEWEGREITGLVTCQMAARGAGYTLLGPHRGTYDAHLVRSMPDGGTPGPTLCGIDRFNPGGPGWSLGGGVLGPEVEQRPCQDCVAVAVAEYPGLAPRQGVGAAELRAAIESADQAPTL
jgi:hypothetical protein